MATLVEKRVPARAMAFAAELQLQPADDGETKIRQGKIVARTGGEAFHWYWGRCVHDLAGMNLPKPRVPLDYCHNPCDVVGFAEGFDAAAGQLECDASLVTHRPEDRAAKLMADSDAGVPYEASILQSAAGLVVEWVDAGATVDVNGQSFSGPGVVFRQWTLRGLATCPQGSDAATSSEFSAGPLAGEVTISNFPGEFSMSTAPAPSPAPAPAPVAPANPPADTGLAAQPPANPPVAPVVAPLAHTGQQFMDAFGEKGAVWFAQGKTFSEAQQLFHAEVAAKNKELTEQVQALTEANQKLRGASEPVSFTGATPDGSQKKQGFAGLIKLPGAAK